MVILASSVIVTSTPSPINVPIGQVLYISCEVTGYPRSSMVWEPPNDRARTEQSDTFVAFSLSKVRANKGGNYKLILKMFLNQYEILKLIIYMLNQLMLHGKHHQMTVVYQ